MANWNWQPDPKKVVHIDLETQSVASLKKVGGSAYLRDSTTRLMCLVAKHDNLVLVWAPRSRLPGRGLTLAPGALWPEGIARSTEGIMFCQGEEPPAELLEWIAKGYTFVAHNATGFDAEAYELLVGGPQPAAWYDTMYAAKARGLPGGLDTLGKLFLGVGKDAPGAKVLKLMYTAKEKGGEIIYPIGTPPAWQLLLRYNVMDVLLLERVFTRTLGTAEPDVLNTHTAINNRGVYVDSLWLDTLLVLWDEAIEYAQNEIERLTEGTLKSTDLRSGPKMKAWLASQGVKIDSLKKEEVERLYEFPEEYFEGGDYTERHLLVSEVLKLRQTVARVGKAKLERIRQRVDTDGRVRGMFLYHGAHTGRWSGRGVQPHNFARGVAGLDVGQLLSKRGNLKLSDITEAAAPLNARADDVLTTVLRPVFRAEPGRALLIADYSAIEARGVAWLANEQSLLDAFAHGADIYCEMAGMIYGRTVTKKDKIERQVGKITVLGCGYSMSAEKFGVFCHSNRIDLAEAGVTAEQCVEAYRSAYPAIAGELSGKYRVNGLWQQYQKAVFNVVKYPGTVIDRNRCRFFVEDRDLHIVLPSGRPIIYRDARIEEMAPPWATDGATRPTLVYTHHRGFPSVLYGGLLTENICQGMCRDLLAHAMVECERRGIPVVLHVHDEIVAETDSDLAVELQRMCEIMTTPPTWAEGFPIAVEGYTGTHYTKSPLPGTWVCEANSSGLIKVERRH